MKQIARSSNIEAQFRRQFEKDNFVFNTMFEKYKF